MDNTALPLFSHKDNSIPSEDPTGVQSFRSDSWTQWQIVQNNPLSMVLVDAQQPAMPIVYVNEAFERNTGYTLPEVIGKNPRFMQGEDRQQEGRAIIRNALQRKEACAAVLRNYRKDGTMFWNEVRISPIRDSDGKVTHFLGVENDITTRKEAELALTRSETRYRQMFDNNSAVKLVMDPTTGRIMDANAAAAAFYGYSCDQLKTMRIQEINTLPEADVFKVLQNAANRERSLFEFRHRLASGEVRDVDVFASPLDTPEGRFIYAIIIDVVGKREAEQRYRSLFEQSNDAVFILDMTGQHLQANRRAAHMLGYEPDELMALSYQDTVIPEQQHGSQNILQRLLGGEHVPPYERTFRRKDGSQVLTEVNVEIVRDTNGQPLHIQSIVRDITARKKMETALAEKYAELDRFFSIVLDLLCIADTDGNFLKVNKAWEMILGYPVEELEHSRFLDFVHPDDLQSTLDAIEQLGQQKSVLQFINRYRCKDGSYRFIEWRSRPYGKLIYGAARDITEHKQMEEAIRESEEKYRLIAENTSDGIVVIEGPTGRITYASPAYDRQSGREIGETIGIEAENIWEVIHPEDRDDIFKRIYEAIAHKAEGLNYSYRSKHKTGHYFWREDHAKFHYAPDGSHLGSYVISRDITDRKQAQHQELELILEKERTRLLTQFIQSSAHEFRTPLSVIGSSAYLLARSNDPEYRRLKTEQIDIQIKGITRLINSLLLMAKLESRDELKFTAMPIASLLEIECHNISATYGDKPPIHCELQADLPLIRGDVTYLTDAFHRLLDNAYRFTSSDGTITVTAGTAEHSVWVEIKDTGQGIWEEDLPHIFETFWRRDTMHTTSGLGLGLPIARRIIEHHGGTITVKSKVGQGTCFRVTLPVRLTD